MFLAFAVALALRVWEAWESSLWLDELHTLAHASLPTAAEVLAHVKLERVHQPLFFLAVHALGGWEQGAWLRALPVLSSLLLFVPVLGFARTSGRGTAMLALSAWVLACLPYQVHYAAELRPYAWLAVFSAGACYAAFTDHGPRWTRFALFFACVLIGMWTHRFMAVAVFSIGFARLFVRDRSLLPLSWLVIAGTLAVAPVLPWMLEFAHKATTDRFEYQASRGGYELRPALVKELVASPTRLFVPYLGALGGASAWIARIAALVFFGAFAACGLRAAFRGRKEAPRLPPPLRALAIYAAADFVLVTAAAVYTWDRIPLQYYAAIAWTLPLAVGWFASSWPERGRKLVVALLAASALALGIAQAAGNCTEDMRRGVEAAREAGATLERPIYTALLSQPTLFEDVLPYRAYGRELETLEPSDVPARGTAGGERPVVVLRRGNIPLSREAWMPLLAGRKVAHQERVDAYLTVFVLTPDDGSGEPK